MEVRVAASAEELGEMAGRDIANSLRENLQQQSRVRMIFAAAPSQSATLAALRREPGIDWSRVTAFHMEEYLGLSADAPERFGAWLMRAFFSHVAVGEVHLIDTKSAPKTTCLAYTALI